MDITLAVDATPAEAVTCWCLKLASRYTKEKDYDNAYKCLSDAINLDCDNSFLLSLCWLARGVNWVNAANDVNPENYEKALIDYNKAIELYPTKEAYDGRSIVNNFIAMTTLDSECYAKTIVASISDSKTAEITPSIKDIDVTKEGR